MFYYLYYIVNLSCRKRKLTKGLLLLYQYIAYCFFFFIIIDNMMMVVSYVQIDETKRNLCVKKRLMLCNNLFYLPYSQIFINIY